MPRRGDIQWIELNEADRKQFNELAARESRTAKDLGTLLIRWALLELRERKIESVSAMTNALYDDEKMLARFRGEKSTTT